MSDGGRERASLGVKVWKSSQNVDAKRSAVRSIAWLDLIRAIAWQRISFGRYRTDVQTTLAVRHSRALAACVPRRQASWSGATGYHDTPDQRPSCRVPLRSPKHLYRTKSNSHVSSVGASSTGGRRPCPRERCGPKTPQQHCTGERAGHKANGAASTDWRDIADTRCTSRLLQ